MKSILIQMVMSEPERIAPSKGRRARNIYIAVFVSSTVAVSFTLSLLGYINLSPLAAIAAGTIAGFALVLFHLTYLRFVGNATYRMYQPEEAIE